MDEENSFLEDGNDSVGGADTPEQEPTTFDISLAARHDYLGSDFEDVRGRILYDEGSLVWMPILFELGIVLLPGQTLPLTVFYPPTVNMLKEIISKDKTFGIVCLMDSMDSPVVSYGTTAEIYQYMEEDQIAGFKVKARGRQRFKLLEHKEQFGGMVIGKVKILPEISLSKPLREAKLPSLNRRRRNGSFLKLAGVRDLACITWPRWLLQHYDEEVLKKRVVHELRALKFANATSNVPDDVANLSFYVAQCLPINYTNCLTLLSLDTAVERLQYVLRLMADCSDLHCEGCMKPLASRRQIFSMSVEGPAGTYCNPTGYVHEILTVHRAQGLVLADETPTKEYSWFPGYGWTVASCETCHSHMGWLFTALSPDLRPAKFWGLKRRNVSMRSL